MLIFAVALLAFTALFGAIIFFHVMKNKPTPSTFVAIHGIFALVALIALISGIIGGYITSKLIIASLILFILAALGGLALLTMDVTKGFVPKYLAMFHPFFAFSAGVLLIIGLMTLK